MRNGENRQARDPARRRDLRRLAIVFGLEEWDALPWPLRLFLSVVGLMMAGLGVLVLVAMVGWHVHREHDFIELAIEPAPGVDLRLNAFGRWTQPADEPGVEVRSSPYVIDIRATGVPAQQAEISELRFVDVATGAVIQPGPLEHVMTRDPNLLLFVDRDGVALPQNDVRAEGVLAVAEGTDTLRYAFSGELRYEYRRERKNSFWEALMGI